MRQVEKKRFQYIMNNEIELRTILECNHQSILYSDELNNNENLALKNTGKFILYNELTLLFLFMGFNNKKNS